MMRFLKENWILSLILLMAFTFRVIGIFYAFPLSVVSDETPTLLASLKMVGTYSLRAADPGYYYPALLSYAYLPFLAVFLLVGRLVGLFGSIDAMKEAVLLNLGLFIPIARFVSVTFGTLSVFLIYKIGCRLFKKTAGLISALFLAVSFFNVSNSHFAQTWTTQTFFIILSLYFAVKFYQQRELGTRDYIIGGLVIGLAFGINFVGVLSYYWFILVHFLKNREKMWVEIFIKNRSFWLLNFSLLLMMCLVYYLNPYGLNNYFSRIIDISAPAKLGDGYSSYKIFHLSFFATLYFYVSNIFIQEPIFFVLSFLGSIFLWLRERTFFYFLVPWTVIYFLFISPLTGATVRYVLPTSPLLIIISCYFILYIKRYFNNYVWGLLIVVITINSFFFSVLFDSRMLQDDTRVLARNWILDNVPSGSTIKNEELGVSLSLIEDKQSTELIKQYRPELFSTRKKYLLSLPDKNYPKPNYLLLTHSDLSLLVQKFDYIILSSFDMAMIKMQARSLPASAKLIKSFYPVSLSDNLTSSENVKALRLPTNDLPSGPWLLLHKVNYNGPFIEIYSLSAI